MTDLELINLEFNNFFKFLFDNLDITNEIILFIHSFQIWI